MLVTSGILLLVVLGAVESFPLNIQGANPSYTFNRALIAPQQQAFPHFQPQFFTNQDSSNLQLNRNAQRYFNPQPLHQNSPRFNPPLQQPFLPQQQQQLQRQVPVLNKSPNLPLQQNYVPAAPQQSRFAPIQQNAPIKTVSPAASFNDKDFLSSLQIIDTQGNSRLLKDFGLGGDGNQPIEPELEKSLKLIFDTINKDLENAAFLPLDLNGRQPHLENQAQPQYFQGAQQAQFGPQQQHLASKGQQQSLGYSFTQPKQHQFQFLKPVRANQNLQNQVKPSQEQPIRGLKQAERNQDEQRPIEQRPIEPIQQEKIEQLPVKGLPEEKQQAQFEDKIQQAPIKSINQEYRETDIRSRPGPQFGPQQSPRKQAGVGQFQAPIEQQPIQTPIQIEQRPVQVAQQHVEQQQGFDDEPAPLKVVEHDSKSHNKAAGYNTQDEQQNKQTRVEQASITHSVVEQEPLDRAPIEQQKQSEDEQRPQQNAYEERPNLAPPQVLQPIKSNVKKFAGWVPIVQQKQIDNFEQQKSIQQHDFEQQNEEQDQKLVVQEKIQQVEQVNENFANTQEVSRDALERPPQQASVQPIFSQQAPTSGKQNRRKSLNNFASPPKTRLSSEQRAEKSFHKQQQQRLEEIPVQQQRQQDELTFAPNFEQQRQEADIDDGRKQEFSQEVQREDTGPIFVAPTTTTTTTTPKPVIRSEQIKGRKVKLQITDRVKTPIQMVREQQSKSIKQQSQLTKEEVKRPKQVLQPANTQSVVKQEDQQLQIKEEPKEQLAPVTIPTFPKASAKQSPRFSDQQKNTERAQQQRQYEVPALNQNQDVNQQQDIRQFQVQVELAQQKEDLNEQKLDVTQRQEETPSQQREESFGQQQQQQQQEIQPQIAQVQQRDETFQQKEDVPTQREELQQPKEVQQKEELPQQREEVPQQKEETLQRKEELAQQREEPQPKEDLGQQQVQENISQQQQKQEDVTQQQQQENFSDQNAQRQEPTPQLPDASQGDTPLQQQQFAQQESVDNPPATRKQPEVDQSQQSVQEEEKRQEDVQVQQPKQSTEDQQQAQLLSQEKQQVAEAPQIQEGKTLIEDEPVITTTQRPPIRATRPTALKKDENQSGKDNGEARQEVTPEAKQENLSTTRSRSKISQQSRQTFKSSGQKQGYPAGEQGNSRSQPRQRLNNRQRQQITNSESVNSPNSQSERQTNEGYLSAHQLLNTYNPLQFEPERISSLSRASSSSQNSNVNSSPSGESY